MTTKTIEATAKYHKVSNETAIAMLKEAAARNLATTNRGELIALLVKSGEPLKGGIWV